MRVDGRELASGEVVRVERLQRRPCRVFWGSHGCRFERGHDGPHECDCCTCLDHDKDPVNGATDPDDEGVTCVAKPPYYGPDTRFYGEDA